MSPLEGSRGKWPPLKTPHLENLNKILYAFLAAFAFIAYLFIITFCSVWKGSESLEYATQAFYHLVIEELF